MPDLRPIFDTLGSDEDEIIAFDDQDDEDSPSSEACAILRTALRQHLGRQPPRDELEAAAQVVRNAIVARFPPYHELAVRASVADRPPDEAAALLLSMTGAVMSPAEPPAGGSGPTGLEEADWLQAVLLTVRGGPGTAFSPADLVNPSPACPEVEGDVPSEERPSREAALAHAALRLQALGLLDGDMRLTPLGEWLLPRGLAHAWGGRFDV